MDSPEEHCRFLIATTIRVPDDTAEHAAILERAGITADRASWIAEQTALRKMMIGILVDAGFDEDSAALVASHVIDEHHSQDEGVWGSHRPRGQPRGCSRGLPRDERGVSRWAENLATRKIEDAGRSDASTLIELARETGSFGSASIETTTIRPATGTPRSRGRASAVPPLCQRSAFSRHLESGGRGHTFESAGRIAHQRRFRRSPPLPAKRLSRKGQIVDPAGSRWPGDVAASRLAWRALRFSDAPVDRQMRATACAAFRHRGLMRHYFAPRHPIAAHRPAAIA